MCVILNVIINVIMESNNRRLTTKLSEYFREKIKLSFVYEKSFDKKLLLL